MWGKGNYQSKEEVRGKREDVHGVRGEGKRDDGMRMVGGQKEAREEGQML